jgi:hypothetical protein
MNAALHRGKLDDAGAALQCMERAEHRVELFRIGGRAFEYQQARGRLLDVLARFDDELAEEFIHRGTPHNIDANSASFTGSIGFTR